MSENIVEAVPQKSEAVLKAVNTKETTILRVRADGFTFDRVDKVTGNIVEEDVSASTFESFIRKWIHGKLGRKSVCGHYRADEEKLWYRNSDAIDNPEILEGASNNDVLAIKLKDGRLIGNASKLKFCGRHRRGDEAPAQRVMFDLHIAMIPFNVFDEAKLDIRNAKVIEQGKEEDLLMPKLIWDNDNARLIPEDVRVSDTFKSEPKPQDYHLNKKVTLRVEKEYVRDSHGNWKRDKKGNTIRKDVKYWDMSYIDKRKLALRHFVGAMLLKVKHRYFLFDIDRNEVKHYRFNPFLSELKAPAKTIAEAYEGLKPDVVKDALKNHVKVLRQGEWFFIETDKKIEDFAEPKNLINPVLRLRPDTVKFGLSRYSINEFNDRYSLKNIAKERTKISRLKRDESYKGLLPKYKKNLLQRFRDYNKALDKWLVLYRRLEVWRENHQFYQYGGELKAGVNRPNTVGKLAKVNGITYVTGKVEHTGREHEPLDLKKWYQAVPNTATRSFTITGNID